jgi:hypothetical protein
VLGPHPFSEVPGNRKRADQPTELYFEKFIRPVKVFVLLINRVILLDHLNFSEEYFESQLQLESNLESTENLNN